MTKRLPKELRQRCSSHFVQPEGKKGSAFPGPIPKPNLTLNHLANEPLRMATILYGLNYGSATDYIIFNKVHDGL